MYEQVDNTGTMIYNRLTGRFDSYLGALPQDLQEIGRIRMLHPEASLEELGQMLKKPVGKSGANHKMRRLMALIQENQRQDGDGRDDQANAEPGGDHAPEQSAD